MDETYIKVAGEWKHLYRAINRAGHTIDFLFRMRQQRAAFAAGLRPPATRMGA